MGGGGESALYSERRGVFAARFGEFGLFVGAPTRVQRYDDTAAAAAAATTATITFTTTTTTTTTTTATTATATANTTTTTTTTADLAEAHTYEKFLHLVDEGKLYGVPTMLAGDLASGISYMTTDNFEYLAEKKFQNFMEYAQLYPEFSHVFVGDNGQGDVRAAELVMTAKRRGSAAGLPGSDEEVLGMLSSDVVPDLTVTYIHVVQPLEKTFGWDKDARSRWRALNIIFVDNYVDAAIHAALVMKPPLIHAHGLRRIMVKSTEDFHAIKEWHKVKNVERQILEFWQFSCCELIILPNRPQRWEISSEYQPHSTMPTAVLTAIPLSLPSIPN